MALQPQLSSDAYQIPCSMFPHQVAHKTDELSKVQSLFFRKKQIKLKIYANLGNHHLNYIYYIRA